MCTHSHTFTLTHMPHCFTHSLTHCTCMRAVCQMGSQALGLLEPQISAITKARIAAKTIMKVADRVGE